MPRYIDADALRASALKATNSSDFAFDNRFPYWQFSKCIKQAPTIDAVPVVRGEWIDSPTGDYAICSYCHVEWSVFDNDTYRFRHCPACGAKMESEGNA